MELDVNDPKFLRWAGAILLAVVVLPAYFMYSGLPFTHAARNKEVVVLEARHEELSRDLEKARLLVRNLERVEQEYAILHEQWDVAQTLLPENNQMPNLLRKVTAAGQQSGVEFEVFRPQASMPRGFYADNPIEVRIRGGYHQTGVFLSRLANLNRIVNVSNLRLQGLEQDENKSAAVETDMILTAYTLEGAGLSMESGTTDLNSSSGKASTQAGTGANTVRATKKAAGH